MSVEPLLSSPMKQSVILTSGASGRINALFSLRALRSVVAAVTAFIVLLFAPFRGAKRTATVVTPEKGKEQQQERKTTTVRVPATIVPWKSGGGGAPSVDAEVAARRALAVRRVMQDVDENTVREYLFFTSPRGDTIFTQSWSPVSIKIRCVCFSFSHVQLNMSYQYFIVFMLISFSK